MILQQTEMMLSTYLEIYDNVVSKDIFSQHSNEMIDFSFDYNELKAKHCHNNGFNDINPLPFLSTYY